ncbi:hypothetical protein GCM10009837_73460 [Streptomyces durmitorensis]
MLAPPGTSLSLNTVRLMLSWPTRARPRPKLSRIPAATGNGGGIVRGELALMPGTSDPAGRDRLGATRTRHLMCHIQLVP